MASKESRGNPSKAAVASANLRREAERSIQKERYKDAVKQAKMCYKEESTPENHQLLERAYFLRARQLLQQGMRESAVEVAQHLLDFGVTTAESLDERLRLLMSLGFLKPAAALQERLGPPEMRDRISELAADQAVIHPAHPGTIAPEVARDAVLVRQAVEKLQAHDEAGAMAALRDLARSSPLSEWKFFVRGLAAFYRGDAAEEQANWDRLDPRRMAFAIAGRLRRLAAVGSDADPKHLEAMEKRVFGEPILDRLQQMRGLTAGQDWDKVLRSLGPLRLSLHRVDPGLSERLTFVLIGSLVKAAQDMHWPDAKRVVIQFTRAAEPLASDPRWNRLWGILWDGPQGDPDDAIPYWVAYIDDLGTVATFNPEERALAQAMIWNHVAELHREQVDGLLDDDDDEDEPPFAFPRFGRDPDEEADEEEIAAAKKEVVDCLERSLRLAPKHLPTYRLLVETYRDWDDEKGLEKAAKRLLKVFPEDVETFQLLARHYQERDDLAAALPYVQKARQLKPLDESLRSLEWTVRVGLARLYALSKRWDEGRAEFAAAEGLQPDCRGKFFYLARKAIFELKAGEARRGEDYLKQAQEALVEPTPLWLTMVIEATRYKMPKATIDRYDRLWEAGLKKKCRGETAGALAEQMGAYLGADVEYRGRAEHIRQVIAYLKRGTGLKYRREDIERVVEFLAELPKAENALLEKLLKAGVKQHPESAVLHLHSGMMGLAKGVITGSGGVAEARRHLETALKLAEASTDPKTTALLPEIRSQVSLLDEITGRLGPLGAFFGGGPFAPPFLDGLGFPDFDDEDDEGWFDEDEDEDEPRAPRSAPPGRKKRTPRKRR
jgi:tetratricopeptide (TPR) repeat protein